jgi:DNA polymerase III delta prime subunit
MSPPPSPGSRSSTLAPCLRNEALITCSRPKTVDEIVFQDEVVAVLKRSLQGHDVCICTPPLETERPRCLISCFTARPGQARRPRSSLSRGNSLGQCSFFLCSVDGGRPELYKERVLELNASDDRGIQAIREKVSLLCLHESQRGDCILGQDVCTADREPRGPWVQDHHPRRVGLDDRSRAVSSQVNYPYPSHLMRIIYP